MSNLVLAVFLHAVLPTKSLGGVNLGFMRGELFLVIPANGRLNREGTSRGKRRYRCTCMGAHVHVCTVQYTYKYAMDRKGRYLRTGLVLIVRFNNCVLSFASEIANLLIVFASDKARKVCYK